MATRGKQIEPTVDWHRPSDPNQAWGEQTEDSDIMRHSFNNADDGTPAFQQDKDYIIAKQVVVKSEIIPGVVVEKIVTVDGVVKGSQIVSPLGQVQTPYLRKDFGFIVAYYEVAP